MGRLTHVALRKEIIAACLDMNATGLNQGTSGNVSARVRGGMLITPSGVPYDTLSPEDIVAVKPDGDFAGALRPSSEWRMHADIYRARSDAGAVVHVHSIAATALACLRRPIPAFHYMVAVAGGDDIRCADYALFGTQALSDAMASALEGRTACLLANHGQIAFGPTVAKALSLAREVETLAAMLLAAERSGKPKILSQAEMHEVLSAFKDYGAQRK
ncbi:MAG: class II aldolase/adducin family protein [Pseudomonadota bacterium]